MKTISTLALALATAVAVIGTGAASADDQQLHNRLALQRAQNFQGNQRTTTIAVYGNQRGIGRSSTMPELRSELRFELRSNAHGQTFGAFVPVK